MKKPSPKKSSLLAKYSLQYERKPRSRVFAPLAETYRKLGMHDEALKILRTGIKYHPDYTLGYIVLAHVYFDKENYEVAYATLRPFISKNLENITLQKLFAGICVSLGYLEEALNTFKCLLLINPRDEDVAKQVKLLEDDLLVPDEEEIPTGFIEKRIDTFDEEDDWVQVDFNQTDKRSVDEYDSWEQKAPSDPITDFKSAIMEGKLDVDEHDLDDEYFLEDHDINSEEVIEPDEDDLDDSMPDEPIITHTLVDLYSKQGYFEKSLELLDNILELHPTDELSLKKRNDIQLLIGDGKRSVTNHGHDKLLDLVEQIDDVESDKLEEVIEKLNAFSRAIKEKSLKNQNI